MKFLLLTLLIATATAAPLDDSQDPVQVIVNGVPEGEPLEIGDIVDIKLKEIVDGNVANTNDLLYPMTAEGLAEIAAAAEPEAIETPVAELPEVVIPEPVELPEVPAPEVSLPEPIELPEVPSPEVSLPEPVVLPEPVAPEVVEPIEEPTPEIIIITPEVVVPEVIAPEDPAPEVPVPQPVTGEVYNDGVVQVTVNTPEDPGVVATLQSWVSMFINYFSGETETTQQII